MVGFAALSATLHTSHALRNMPALQHIYQHQKKPACAGFLKALFKVPDATVAEA